MTKKRKILIVFLIIVVTALCIWLGFRTRYNNKIVITQLAGEGEGYILETPENNLILIDGGTENDVNQINTILQNKQNSKILAWFLTSAENNKIGALCEVLRNYPNINVPNIYVSFYEREIYDNANLDRLELEKLNRNLDLLYSNGNIEKLIDMQRRAQYKFDNYYITPLEIKTESNCNIYNQTVILKIDNTFKNIILLSDISDEKCNLFLENNKDQYDCDGLELSPRNIKSYGTEIFNKMKPKYVFVSDNSVPSYVNAELVYVKNYGENTIDIW